MGGRRMRGNSHNAGGGQFCGIVGPRQQRPVFISETNKLTATIRFFQFYGEELENNFSFRLRYKFLSKEASIATRARLIPSSSQDAFPHASSQGKARWSNVLSRVRLAVRKKERIFLSMSCGANIVPPSARKAICFFWP